MLDAKKILVAIKYRTKENPIYSPELERTFECSGAEVRDCIRGLRRQGYPIANDNGYYWATTYKEIEPTINDLLRRAYSMMETVKLLKKRFNIIEESNTLFN